MTCVEGSSPDFPSNLGMLEDRFTGITGHEGLCEIWSFFNHDKSGKSNIVRKGNGANEYWEGDGVYVVPNETCCAPVFVLLED
jgi:hypothetical protein